MDRPPKPNKNWDGKQPDPATSSAPWRVYNIGNNSPVELLDYITALEKALGKTAQKNLLPLQAGDVPATYANIDSLTDLIQFKPNTSVNEGVKKFVSWYRAYYP